MREIYYEKNSPDLKKTRKNVNFTEAKIAPKLLYPFTNTKDPYKHLVSVKFVWQLYTMVFREKKVLFRNYTFFFWSAPAGYRSSKNKIIHFKYQ